MFTGIVENIGRVSSIDIIGTNKTFWIESPLSHEFKVDQSISHSGVCLTIEEVTDTAHRVTAIEETLKKTTIHEWTEGSLVNLERCLPINGRLDGHFVQGHVDATGLCILRTDRDGSWEFRFSFPGQFAELVIEKGSISLNGISLTVFDVTETEFSVGIIPYTYSHTNLQQVVPGTSVNLEFDIIGKYLLRKLTLALPSA